MGSSNGKIVLRDEDIAALSKTSGLSAEQIQDKFSIFTSEHPNGKLNKKDFRKMISEALPKKDVSKMEKHVFRVYDTNKDGYIDFVEFMVVFHILSEGTPEEVLLRLFRTFDVNGDGQISKKEMQRLVKDLHSLMDTEGKGQEKSVADAAFSEMDSDKDGVVTSGEFVRAVLGHEAVSRMLTMNIMNIFIDQK